MKLTDGLRSPDLDCEVQEGLIMPGKAAKVTISERQQVVLEEFSRSRTASKCVSQRATIVLLAFQGLRNEVIAPRVGLNRQQVGIWRQRWRDVWTSLCAWECSEPNRLREAILEVFTDAPRSGSPGKFTPEQIAQIIALACESPALSERADYPLDAQRTAGRSDQTRDCVGDFRVTSRSLFAGGGDAATSA